MSERNTKQLRGPRLGEASSLSASSRPVPMSVILLHLLYTGFSTCGTIWLRCLHLPYTCGERHPVRSVLSHSDSDHSVISHWDSVTPWTVTYQAPRSMGFSRQEYWSGLLCPPSGDLPDPGIKPASLASPALAGRLLYHCTTWEAHGRRHTYINSSHKQQELQKTYLKSNLIMNMYANSLKLQIEYPVVFLLTFNSSSLGISKIISQRWLKELSFSWSGLSLFFPFVWHLHVALILFYFRLVLLEWSFPH